MGDSTQPSTGSIEMGDSTPPEGYKKTDGDSILYSSISKTSYVDFLCWCKKRRWYKGLKPFQELFVDEDILERSLKALRFAVLCNAANSTILKPNYPIMALPGGHPDSFESTAPFDFNAATYFLPMCALLGVAIASTITGKVSDRVGRKPVILVSLIISGVGSILKFLLQKSFWGFCGASFLTGLFSATLPIAMAYASDVNPSKKKSDAEVGLMVGFNMLGTSGGGICAILLEEQGLFVPLWIGVALMIISSITTFYYIIEPKTYKELYGFHEEDEDEDDNNGLPIPTVIDKKTCVNIIFGAFADNVGSSGLVPLCLSPLMFDKYYTDFMRQGMSPIMSQNDYKWISVMLSLMVIPSTVITPALFSKIGSSGSCVFGNSVTGVVTVMLLLIGEKAPATTASYAGFIAILYAAFPFTVISQLTTGPMLDVICPPDKRGFIQGLNISVMNFGMALTPWVLGIVADIAGTATAIWICIGVSFGAALVNAPLMCKPGLGPTKERVPEYYRPIEGEDEELMEKILRGSWVPAETMYALKTRRRELGKPQPITRVSKYEDDKDKLNEIRKNARADFAFMQNMALEFLRDFNNEEDKQALCDKFVKSMQGDPEEIAEVNKEMGQWFTDYLVANGYSPHYNTILFKMMIMTAFPCINTDEKITPDNFEEVMLRNERLLYSYARDSDDEHAWWKVLSNKGNYPIATLGAR